MEEKNFGSIKKIEGFINDALTVGEQMKNCSSYCVDIVEQMVKLYRRTTDFLDTLQNLPEREAEDETYRLKTLYTEVDDMMSNARHKTKVVYENTNIVAEGIYSSICEVEKDYKELTIGERKNCNQEQEEVVLQKKQKMVANEYSQSLKENEQYIVDVVRTKEAFDQNTANLSNLNFAWQTDYLQRIERIANAKFDSFSPTSMCIRNIATISQYINNNLLATQQNLQYCKLSGDNLCHNCYRLYEVNKNLQEQQKQNIQSQNVENIK